MTLFLQISMSAATGLSVLILTRNVLICQEHLDVNVKMATSNYRMEAVKVCSVLPHRFTNVKRRKIPCLK